MRKLFLIISLVAWWHLLSAQGNGDFVSFHLLKLLLENTTMLYLNEKWKELQLKCELDEGTITGWDAWWRPGATSEF